MLAWTESKLGSSARVARRTMVWTSSMPGLLDNENPNIMQRPSHATESKTRPPCLALDSPDDLVFSPLASRGDRRGTEVWQHFCTEQLDRAQHLPLREAGKAKGAKDMLNARGLHLL